MNKPKDYVPPVRIHMPNILFLNLSGTAVPRVYPVRQLDKATTGVLLLTNDGDLAGKLNHPKYKRRKKYIMFFSINPVTKKTDLFRLAEGLNSMG